MLGVNTALDHSFFEKRTKSLELKFNFSGSSQATLLCIVLIRSQNQKGMRYFLACVSEKLKENEKQFGPMCLPCVPILNSKKVFDFSLC